MTPEENYDRAPIRKTIARAPDTLPSMAEIAAHFDAKLRGITLTRGQQASAAMSEATR